MGSELNTLHEFDAERLEVNNINGEAELRIHLKESDSPLTLYLDFVDYVHETMASHEGLEYP